MNEKNTGFCISCGVARNYGDTCDYCGRHYVNPTETPQKAKRITALPSKYKITRKSDGTAITWRWAAKSGWVLIMFSMVWLAITYQIAADFLKEPGSALPLPLLPMAVGFILLGHAIMKLINRTSINASKQSLYMKHHPIPWRGSFKIPTSNIEQVFVSRTQRSNEKTTWHAPALQLITKDGQRHQLLRGRSEAEFSDFESLRLIILKALNIKPETIAGAHDSFGP